MSSSSASIESSPELQSSDDEGSGSSPPQEPGLRSRAESMSSANADSVRDAALRRRTADLRAERTAWQQFHVRPTREEEAERERLSPRAAAAAEATAAKRLPVLESGEPPMSVVSQLRECGAEASWTVSSAKCACFLLQRFRRYSDAEAGCDGPLSLSLSLSSHPQSTSVWLRRG